MCSLQVSDAVSGEKKRLEEEQARQIDRLKSRHAQELEDVENSLERKHRTALDAIKTEMEEQHKQVTKYLAKSSSVDVKYRHNSYWTSNIRVYVHNPLSHVNCSSPHSTYIDVNMFPQLVK